MGKDRFESLEELEDDWNSYGAIAPHAGAIRRARELEVMLGCGFVICPTPTGNIAFEWNNGSVIEIGPAAGKDSIHLEIDE